MINWARVRDTESSDQLEETALENVIGLDHVSKCCDSPDLRFQRMDVTPTADYFRVVCKFCGRVGEATDWSWGKAVALWNIALWNPTYMGRDPLKLADELERIDLNSLTLKDLSTVLESLKKAPRYLRSLVYEVETAKIEPHIME